MAVSPTTRVFKGKGEKERIGVQDGLWKGVHATASLKITYTGICVRQYSGSESVSVWVRE